MTRVPFSMLTLAALLGMAAPALASDAFQPNRTEELLSAAGFQAVPANTPERAAQMAMLTPHKVLAQPNGASFTFVYADPKGCNCLYMGDSSDMQAYERLVSQERTSEGIANAEAIRAETLLDWPAWGPFGGWAWAGPVFIHGGGHVGHLHR